VTALLLEVGKTCWRATKANRAAVLIDAAAYFAAVRSALQTAKSSIHMLNWAFDPDTRLCPRDDADAGPEYELGAFLIQLAAERPELKIRILCWKSAVLVSATQHFFPHRARRCFKDTPIQFHLDATVPLGGCHHQKVIIVDGRIAFVGSCDFSPDRWDTPEHMDADPRRRVSGRAAAFHEPRHEVMAIVDGGAAQSLASLFARRWLRAIGEDLAPDQPTLADAWPDRLEPQFNNVTTGLSRTEPGWRGREEVREIEALHLASIASARRCIYLENQYLTSPVVGAALAARLADPDGPEVILVSNQLSPSWFDQMTMDRRRSRIISLLRSADTFGRLRAYVPVTAAGTPIVVHAKLSIMDDDLLHVGSANLNNRSGGFDTECDLTIEVEPGDDANQAGVVRCRNQLIAHWLACSVSDVASAVNGAGSVGGGIEHLRARGYTRLSPLESRPLGPIGARFAGLHLGDPVGVADSWKPWKRTRAIRAALAIGLRRAA
jgi:phosphatidylserine/phosphatidylglycerophosphate/cardiolipin synthase-like enzyme